MTQKRLDGLDTFRGFAIVLMILYHFIYDLSHFGLIELAMNHTPWVLVFRYTIITMFLMAVGVSLAMVHGKKMKYASLKKRIIFLSLSALLVSITTYVLFPQHWIYFGILHSILVASLITIPLLSYPKITFLLIPIIFFGWLFDYLSFNFLYELLKEPLALPTEFSLDRIPLFPWLSVILLGTLITYYNFHTKLFRLRILEGNTPIHTLLKTMGRNALLIYLIHQPILFGGFYLYFILVSI